MSKFLYTSVAALSLVTASTVAAAAPVSAPVARVSTPLTQTASEQGAGENQFVGVGIIALFIGLGSIAAVIAAIVAASKNPTDSIPVSP